MQEPGIIIGTESLRPTLPTISGASGELFPSNYMHTTTLVHPKGDVLLPQTMKIHKFVNERQLTRNLIFLCRLFVHGCTASKGAAYNTTLNLSNSQGCRSARTFSIYSGQTVTLMGERDTIPFKERCCFLSFLN